MIGIPIPIQECAVVCLFSATLALSDLLCWYYSFTDTKSNLHFSKSLDTVFKEPGQ
jgi:hypothetical protein